MKAQIKKFGGDQLIAKKVNLLNFKLGKYQFLIDVKVVINIKMNKNIY